MATTLPNNTEELAFFDSSSYNNYAPSAPTGQVLFADQNQSLQPAYTQHPVVFQNKTQEYLNQKGLSWLLDVDDEDELEMQKPLLEELDIDVKDIVYKLRVVAYPIGDRDWARLQEPDFWGPFAIVLAYALLIVWGQLRAVSWVFTIWIAGSFILWQLTNAIMSTQIDLDAAEDASSPSNNNSNNNNNNNNNSGSSYWKVMSVVGYALLPLVLASLVLIPATPLVGKGSFGALFTFAVRFAAALWATQACTKLIVNERELKDKKMMAVYPIALLFFYFMSLYSGA